MKSLRPLVFLVACALATTALRAAEPVVRAEDLPRVPPTEPVDALKTFSVRPGFQVQLVAAEPNVIDPIALCFDADGRMFVVEMRDYSERRAEALGRIRMLEDLDGDGVYEKSTVFCDKLPWPTAVFPWKDGILIGACPDIIYARDTTGDGVADEKQTLFTGFGATQEKLNVQGLFNNFQWGLDNRIHGCSGLNGGMVTSVTTSSSRSQTPPLDVRGKNFLINPHDWSMTTSAGGGQYGLSFNHLGQLFTCSNSVHIESFLYDSKYAARNPHVTLPDPRVCIAADGPAAEVFRTSPEEPWRVMRTRWRVAGLVKGQIEGGGRSAGYFTGATGVTIYKGDAFGPDYVGDAFIGDAGGNLVHHKKVRPDNDGVALIAERPPDERRIEFCASSDNWFRPVDFANAPDGSLLVCDMYRETIEHPWSIPESIKQYLDLNSGNDRGRIWRLAPEGFRYRRAPRFSGAGIAELVRTLEHPNGWHRDTASRLIFERQDKSAARLLSELLAKSPAPPGRMHALYALDGLSELKIEHVRGALGDPSEIVREHAIKLSESFLPSDVLDAALAKLVDDPSPRVRYQLAFSAGYLPVKLRVPLLSALSRRDGGSQWMQAAILSSLSEGADALLAGATDDSFAAKLAGIIGAQNDPPVIGRVIDTLVANNDDRRVFAIATAIAERAPVNVRPKLQPLFDRATRVLDDAESAAVPQAVALLAFADYEPAAWALLRVLDESPSSAVRSAALTSLDRFTHPDLARQLIARHPHLTLRLREQTIAVLLKRPDRAAALLDAIERQRILPDALNATQVAFLHKHADADLRRHASKLLPPLESHRAQVIEAFRPSVTMGGDATRGKAVYQKLCISCHRADGEGHALGPDLVTVRNAGREKLLLSILDPNREVQPNYISFLIETTDGNSLLGVLSSDTLTSVTLREAYGKETVIPRSRIKRMTSQGRSIMPEGLDAGLKQEDVADLMTFIEAAK